MRPGKKERRHYYRELQASFPLAQYEAWNRLLLPKLQLVLSRVPENSLVAVYQARTREASLAGLFSLPYRFCFPKVLNRNGLMEFREVRFADSLEEFSSGPWGILEPNDHCEVVAKSEMAAGFVPLLAFDKVGGRLGQGKGFYDRFLDHFTGIKVGVAFEWQFSPIPLPTEGHDHNLDLVVSESTIREF